MLGEAIFNGGVGVDGSAALPLIVGYTIVHFIAFAAFGTAFAILMAATDREPMFALGGVIVFAIFEVFFLGWVTLIDASLLEALGWWKIIAANVLALVAIIAYEVHRHPGLVLRLEERWAMLDGEGDPTAPPTPIHAARR
jgi:hypothetical protein